MAESDHFDWKQLLAEIEEDARGSRREGIIAPFQRQLDALSDRLSQPTTSDDLEQVVTSAEELAYVSTDMPAASTSWVALSRRGEEAPRLLICHYVTDVAKPSRPRHPTKGWYQAASSMAWCHGVCSS